MKKEVKSIVKNIAIPTVDEFVKNLPMDYIQIKAAWFAFKNSYGLFADLFQDEAIEFLENVKNNINEIGDEILQSKDFKQGLLISLEQIARLRQKKKRMIAQRIFLGFMSSKDRDNFDLEKMYQTLNLLSFDALKLLCFIKSKILPELKRRSKHAAESHAQTAKPDTDVYQKVFDENYAMYIMLLSIGSSVAPTIWREKLAKTRNVRDVIFELGNLGILRIEKGEEWRQPQINNFGLAFMEFIA